MSWFDKQRSQFEPTKKSFFTDLVVLVSNRGSMFELFVVTVQSLWNRKNKCGLILLNEACFPLDKLSDITKSNKAGIGIVVCDSQGEVLVVLSNQKKKKKAPTSLPTSVVTLEVLAARRAVLLVQEICINHSIFEGDSKLAVNSLHCGNMQSSSFGHFNQ